MTEDRRPLPLGATWRLWWDYERRRPIGGSPVARIGQISRRWEVLRALVISGLKADYGGSFLGYAWTMATPLSMVLIYWIVFGHVVRLNIAHYPLFVAAGVMPWMYFNTVVNDSMRALRNNSGIIRTINVPREIFPLAITGQALIEYLLSLPIVFLMGFGYGVWPSRFIVLLPVAAAIETILVVGIGLLLAAINTLVRDTTKVIRPIIRILFYLSPIVYPASRVHAGLALTLYKLNPIVGITELNRLTWYPHYLIAPSTIFQHALISLIGALLFFGVGWAVFVRVEPLALKEL